MFMKWMAVACLLSTALSAAELTTKKALNLAVAKEMVAAAEAEARKNNWEVVIVVTDESGNLIAMERMDGAQLGSIAIATDKARAAALFRRPTKAFADATKTGNLASLRAPGQLPIQGGVPVMVDGKCLGAVGVSGVTAEQDEVVALAGLKPVTK